MKLYEFGLSEARAVFEALGDPDSEARAAEALHDPLWLNKIIAQARHLDRTDPANPKYVEFARLVARLIEAKQPELEH